MVARIASAYARGSPFASDLMAGLSSNDMNGSWIVPQNRTAVGASDISRAVSSAVVSVVSKS